MDGAVQFEFNEKRIFEIFGINLFCGHYFTSQYTLDEKKLNANKNF